MNSSTPLRVAIAGAGVASGLHTPGRQRRFAGRPGRVDHRVVMTISSSSLGTTSDASPVVFRSSRSEVISHSRATLPTSSRAAKALLRYLRARGEAQLLPREWLRLQAARPLSPTRTGGAAHCGSC